MKLQESNMGAAEALRRQVRIREQFLLIQVYASIERSLIDLNLSHDEIIRVIPHLDYESLVSQLILLGRQKLVAPATTRGVVIKQHADIAISIAESYVCKANWESLILEATYLPWLLHR